ncbi:MAG: adenylate/guanylate cyclase domain-containing protein [Spirochaetales bacterium]|nr:adenylate/guanylate cyclase domain-containing protein [Spirochaetales bacterium]
MKKIILKIIRGAFIGLAGGGLALLLLYTGIISGFEGQTWDLRARLMASPGQASNEIAVILLDQKSLDWGENTFNLSWPWPREIMGVIVDFCGRAGAKGLAFDVIYSEPSFYGPGDDGTFGDALAGYGRAVGAVVLSDESGDGTWPEAFEDKLPAIEVSGGIAGRASSGVSFPVDELAPAFAAFGNVSEQADPDGIFREARLVSLFNGRAVPLLSVGLYLLAYPGLEASVSEKGFTVGPITFPLNAKGNAVIRYRGASGTYPTYSAAAIINSELRLNEGLEPEVKPEELAGKYVLFGYSAPGLKDLRPSPVDENAAGVEIHAAVLDNLLTGSFMVDMPPVSVVIVCLLPAICIGIAASLFSATLPTILLFFAAFLLPVGGGLAGYALGVRFPVVAPLIGCVVAMVSVSVYNFSTEGKQRRFLKGAFKQYLSPALIEQLIANPDMLRLGGERKELSMFFSDLQGFTSISEALTPEELTSLLNDYLSAMTDIILEEGGTVDKYEGDAIIAFWNAPLDLEDHAVHAVSSALRCQTKLAELRPGFRERTGRDMYMRIGLNTAAVVVGNMGSHGRFDYTMMGDGVNLAARLEGINKQFHTYTMISQWTKEKIGDAFPVRELSRVAVVGKKEAVTVYEPMYPEEFERKRDLILSFQEGLALFYKGKFQEAKAVFTRTAQSDPAAAAYAEKCGELALKPPSSWEGVWVMTTK